MRNKAGIVVLVVVTVICLFLSSLLESENINRQKLADINWVSLRVAKYYGENNPKVTKVVSTEDEVTKAPLYLVTIEGDFQAGEKHATSIEFSMLASKNTSVWALTAFNKNLNNEQWEDNSLSFSN